MPTPAAKASLVLVSGLLGVAALTAIFTRGGRGHHGDVGGAATGGAAGASSSGRAAAASSLSLSHTRHTTISKLRRRLEFLDELSFGATGKVLRARYRKKSRRLCALKVVNKTQFRQRFSDPDLQLLREEVAILRAVSRASSQEGRLGGCRPPPVVELFDVFETPNNVFIVMELAAGGDLFQYIQTRLHPARNNNNSSSSYHTAAQQQQQQQQQQYGGASPGGWASGDGAVGGQTRGCSNALPCAQPPPDAVERQARHVVRQVAEALRFLHRMGIMHRDLKPENILVVGTGGGGDGGDDGGGEDGDELPLITVKLCDFGLSTFFSREGRRRARDATRTGSGGGRGGRVAAPFDATLAGGDGGGSGRDEEAAGEDEPGRQQERLGGGSGGGGGDDGKDCEEDEDNEEEQEANGGAAEEGTGGGEEEPEQEGDEGATEAAQQRPPCTPQTPIVSEVGTVLYQAPEVRAGLSGGYSWRCDYWSLGVVAYICLCGYPPAPPDVQFESEAGGDIWEDISQSAKHLVTALLQPDPARRLVDDPVLQHPWLAGGDDNVAAAVVLDTDSRDDVVDDVGVMEGDAAVFVVAARDDSSSGNDYFAEGD